MGKNRLFDSITWLPFIDRRGNIAITNFYLDGITPKPIQSHLKHPPFSFFEIVKYQQNDYYGKLDDYLNDGYEYSFGGDFLKKDNRSIDISFFDKKESNHMIAYWVNIDHDELIPDLKFVGSRPFELEESEKQVFWELANVGQQHIEKTLRLHHDKHKEY